VDEAERVPGVEQPVDVLHGLVRDGATDLDDEAAHVR
jgi:hypothetical protein